MAVYLSMNMSYVGQGDYTNTSKILVEVVATWNYPHYNRDGSTLLVTVDGEDHQTSVIFNPSELSSGTQKLYSYYWNISQPNGSATTVYGYASCQVTNSTTATPAYAELYLAAIGGTGGSTGGNPDGGSTGENPGGGSEGGSNPDSGGTPDIDDPDDDFDYEDYGDPKETVSETLGGITVTADIYYGSGPEVIVKVSRTDLPWRINGTNSGGDHGTYYIPQNNDSVRSFNSNEEEHDYAFQICYSGSWSNGDVFTVNFGDDDSEGDDSGGGGSVDSSPPRILQLEQGEGTYLYVQFWASSQYDQWKGFEGNESAVIRYNGIDAIRVTTEAQPGYELDYYDNDGYVLGYRLENLEFYMRDPEYPDVIYFRLASDGDARIISTAHKIDEGEGGDSGGGNGGESDWLPKDASYIYIQQGTGTKLTVTRISVDSSSYLAQGDYIGELVGGTPIIDKNGETWYRHKGWNKDFFSIEAEALPGYTIEKYRNDGISETCNYEVSKIGAMYYGSDYYGSYGWVFDTDPAFTAEDERNQAWIRSKATPNVPTVKIDTDGSGFNHYVCYINTEIFPQTTTECEIIGQRDIIGYIPYGTVDDPSCDYRTNAYSSWGSRGRLYSYLYCLKFKTKSNLGVGTHTSITFHIKTDNKISLEEDTNTFMNYALCTSDINYKNYALSFDTPPIDEYRIASGTFNEVPDSVSSIFIDNVELSSDTDYYLFVWDVSSNGTDTSIFPSEYHSVMVTREDHEDTNNTILEFLPYSVYIDNGEGWELL